MSRCFDLAEFRRIVQHQTSSGVFSILSLPPKEHHLVTHHQRAEDLLRRNLRGSIIGCNIGVIQSRISCLHFHLAGSASASRALCRRDLSLRRALHGGLSVRKTASRGPLGSANDRHLDRHALYHLHFEPKRLRTQLASRSDLVCLLHHLPHPCDLDDLPRPRFDEPRDSFRTRT